MFNKPISIVEGLAEVQRMLVPKYDCM